MYDVTNRSSFMEVKQWIETLKSIVNISKKEIVIVGNKVDIISHRVISEEEGEELAASFNCKYFECSVKNNINMENIFQYITNQIVDPSLNRLLLVNVEIEKILASLEMKRDQIPSVFSDDPFKTYNFLKHLLNGKQTIRKQTIMVVGEGIFIHCK